MTPTSLTWKSALGRGAIAIVLGIMAIFWPDTAIFTFMLIWGIWALLDGIAVLFLAFQPEARAARTMLLVQGGIGVVVGVLIVTHPGLSASVVTWLAGVWFVVRGLLEGLSAFGTSPRASCSRAPRSTSSSVCCSWRTPAAAPRASPSCSASLRWSGASRWS